MIGHLRTAIAALETATVRRDGSDRLDLDGLRETAPLLGRLTHLLGVAALAVRCDTGELYGLELGVIDLDGDGETDPYGRLADAITCLDTLGFKLERAERDIADYADVLNRLQTESGGGGERP